MAELKLLMSAVVGAGSPALVVYIILKLGQQWLSIVAWWDIERRKLEAKQASAKSNG